MLFNAKKVASDSGQLLSNEQVQQCEIFKKENSGYEIRNSGKYLMHNSTTIVKTENENLTVNWLSACLGGRGLKIASRRREGNWENRVEDRRPFPPPYISANFSY